MQGAYRDKHQLVVQPGAVFPDICIGCGKPASRLDDDVRNTEPVKVLSRVLCETRAIRAT